MSYFREPTDEEKQAVIDWFYASYPDSEVERELDREDWSGAVVYDAQDNPACDAVERRFVLFGQDGLVEPTTFIVSEDFEGDLTATILE